MIFVLIPFLLGPSLPPPSQDLLHALAVLLHLQPPFCATCEPSAPDALLRVARCESLACHQLLSFGWCRRSPPPFLPSCGGGPPRFLVRGNPNSKTRMRRKANPSSGTERQTRPQKGNSTPTRTTLFFRDKGITQKLHDCFLEREMYLTKIGKVRKTNKQTIHDLGYFSPT